MYHTTSSGMEYRKQRNEAEYNCYNDDFEGYSKELEKKEELESQEKSEKSILRMILRKLGNGEKKL